MTDPVTVARRPRGKGLRSAAAKNRKHGDSGTARRKRTRSTGSALDLDAPLSASDQRYATGSSGGGDDRGASSTTRGVTP